MEWARIFGVFLLLTSLVLAILFSVQVPVLKTTSLFKESTLDVEPVGIGNDFYNATIEPVGRKDYTLVVSVLPYAYNTSSINVDLWVVSPTSVFPLIILTEAWAQGELNQTQANMLSAEYYANPPNLPNVTAYANELDITGGQGDLTNLNRNGTYCFVLLSFLQTSQTVSVSIEEQYIESYQAWLESSPATIMLVVAVLIAGVCLIIANPRRSAAKANRRQKKR
jgi:hypothetical protein